MKNTIAKSFIALTVVAILSVLTFAQDSNDFLITKNSVGKVKLGMTVGEAKRIWKNYKFERTSDGEFSALIAVKKGNQQLVTVHAEEKGNLEKNSQIRNDARITALEVWDQNFKTAEGVHPLMPVKKAEKIYGKVKRITRSEIESREYADFTDQPPGIDFRLSSNEDLAGVKYERVNTGDEEGLVITEKYVPSAYIFNILIAQRGIAENTAENEFEDVKFTSYYTDLKTDCIEQPDGEEGGHVSYFCKGPGNYRIHYFDSATTLEFHAETLDGEKSAHLASQSLTYLEQNAKIEWRIADGRPFAVIMPVYEYKTKDGLIDYPANITGEKIIVKGLEGFERINYAEAGKGAIDRARTLADNDYLETIIPAKRIETRAGDFTVTLDEVLVKGDEKVKYLLKVRQGYRMTITINTVDYQGEEGPVMYGIVTSPKGEKDGQPGGRIFDSVTRETGDYEILISQNKAKSNTANIRFKVTITLQPGYEK